MGGGDTEELREEKRSIVRARCSTAPLPDVGNWSIRGTEEERRAGKRIRNSFGRMNRVALLSYGHGHGKQDKVSVLPEHCELVARAVRSYRGAFTRGPPPPLPPFHCTRYKRPRYPERLTYQDIKSSRNSIYVRTRRTYDRAYVCA